MKKSKIFFMPNVSDSLATMHEKALKLSTEIMAYLLLIPCNDDQEIMPPTSQFSFNIPHGNFTNFIIPAIFVPKQNNSSANVNSEGIYKTSTSKDVDSFANYLINANLRSFIKYISGRFHSHQNFSPSFSGKDIEQHNADVNNGIAFSFTTSTNAFKTPNLTTNIDARLAYKPVYKISVPYFYDEAGQITDIPTIIQTDTQQGTNFATLCAPIDNNTKTLQYSEFVLVAGNGVIEVPIELVNFVNDPVINCFCKVKIGKNSKAIVDYEVISEEPIDTNFNSMSIIKDINGKEYSFPNIPITDAYLNEKMTMKHISQYTNKNQSIQSPIANAFKKNRTNKFPI